MFQLGAPTPLTSLCGEAQGAWCGRVGQTHSRAPADALQSLFNDLNLYPTKAQVFEMLVIARQSGRRVDLTIAFGEFCFLAAQLRKYTLNKTFSSKSESGGEVPPPDFSRIVQCQQIDNCFNKTQLPTGHEHLQHPYEVFLGGSCNPTTWRSDVAIPTLEKMAITYFNPQVADWSSELIEIEHRAKDSARVLFFVLDADTRAAAAAVEAAHLAAAPRPLVLVLQPYRRGQKIGGEVITDQEYLDLSRGQAILQEVAERRNLPVFTELPPALRYTYQLLREGRPYSPNTVTPSVALHLKKARDAFDAADESKSGKLSPIQTVNLLQTYTGVELSLAHVENLIDMLSAHNKSPNHHQPLQDRNDSDGSAQDVTFQLFCLLVAEVLEDAEGDHTTTKINTTKLRRDASSTAPGYNQAPSSNTSSPSVNPTKSCGSYSKRREQDNSGSRSKQNSNVLEGDSNGTRKEDASSRGGLAKGRKLSVIIPKTPSVDGVNVSSSVLTPQTTQRLEGLADSIRDEPMTRDVYLGGSCIIRTSWREDVVIPMLKKHNLTYHKPEMNDYNRIFSAPPYTPANGGKFSFDSVISSKSVHTQNTNGRSVHRSSVEQAQRLSKHDTSRNSSKHERSPTISYESNQPEKKPKYWIHERVLSEMQNASNSVVEDVEIRRKEGPYSLQSDNRLSASDFYKISGNATPDPFRGMFDERQVHGSRVLFFGVTSDTRCLSPMVLASHCIGLRPRAVVLCVQLLQHVEGLSESAIKDYNRGRLYLKDLALREGVPVFDSIEEAAQCVIRKLQTGDY